MWPFSRSKPGRTGSNQADDFVWLSSAARTDGVATLVDRALTMGSHIILTGHHPEALEATCALLTDEPRALEMVSGPMTATRCLQWLLRLKEPTCIVAESRWLIPTAATSGHPPDAPLTIVALGRHPLRRFDDDLVTYATGVSPSARVAFHVSMDDPLMKAFSGEKQVAVLKRLGMTETDSISHPFLTRAIVKAQAKMAQQVQRTGELLVEGFEPLTRAHLQPKLPR